METIVLVLFWSFIGGVVSLTGGFLLLKTHQKQLSWVRWALPFGAGSLLAVSLLDLLPEALHDSDSHAVLPWALGGFLAFFVLERTVHWFHHHHDHDVEHGRKNAQKSLIVVGDTIHNAIDGAAIGAAFLIDVPTGIVASLAVAAHEIPQEIADFGFLLSRGMKPRRVVMVNVLSSLATVVAALTVFLLGSSLALPLAPILALTAGFFIYIAASDIIPEIHERPHREANKQAVALLLGVAVIAGMLQLLGHDHAGESAPTESCSAASAHADCPDDHDH